VWEVQEGKPSWGLRSEARQARLRSEAEQPLYLITGIKSFKMSTSESSSEMVEVFEQFRPRLGEGLTGRAARLESIAKADAPSTGQGDALDDSEQLSRRLALGAAPGQKARWLEGVLAEDELRQSDDSGARCAEQRWKQFREFADLLAFTLEQTKYAKVAPGVRSCHQIFRGFACANGHLHAKASNSCDVRLCPFEMRARAMHVLHRFRTVIEELPQGKYLVLAERNAPAGGLVEGINHLFESWKRFRKMAICRQVRGAIVALEITYNRDVMEPDFRGNRLPWHPHLNIVFDSPYIPFEQLRDAWIQASEGRGRTAFVRAVDRGTANELLKYVTKLLDFIDIPLAVEEFLDATHRKRFIRTYGCLYALNIENEPQGRCPDCNSRILTVIAHKLYPNQLFFDSEGVVRIHDWAIAAACHKRAAAT
jgi:hypothetical protein